MEPARFCRPFRAVLYVWPIILRAAPRLPGATFCCPSGAGMSQSRLGEVIARLRLLHGHRRTMHVRVVA